MTSTNTIIADLQAEISQLKFALADTEALELGTAERLVKAQSEIEELKDVILLGEKVVDMAERERKQLASAQAENLKLREALQSAVSMVGHQDNIEYLNTALSTPSDTTALTEYRNGVLEEAAKVCEDLPSGLGEIIDLFTCAVKIRAMKEKP